MAYGGKIGEAFIEIGAELAPSAKNAEKSVRDMFSSISSTVGDAAKLTFQAGLGTAATLTAAAVGKSISSGFNRYINIDDAQTKLKALGYSGRDVESIMSSVNDSVVGTAFGLGDAAKTASLYVSSAIKPGKDLNSALDGTVALAGLAGTSLDDMTQALVGSAASGKLSARELRMLEIRGVNALSILQDAYGVTAEEARKMVSDGKVSFSDFMSAVNKTTGDAAVIMGTSIRSMWENFNAALGRAGEKIVGPLLEGFRTVAPALTSVVDALGEQVGQAMEGIGKRLEPVFDSLAKWLENLASSGALDSIIGMFEKFKGAAILLASAGIGPLLQQIPIIGRVFSGLTGPVGLVIGLFIQMWTESEILRDAVTDAFEKIVNAIDGSGGTFEMISGMISTLAKVMGDSLGTAINIVVPIIETLLNLFNSMPDGVQKTALAMAGAGLGASALGISFGDVFRAGSKIGGLTFKALSDLPGTADAVVRSFDGIRLTGMYAKDGITQVVNAVKGLPGHATAAASAVGRLGQTLMNLSRKALMGLVGGLKKAALAMKGLAVSMLTNPIGIAVLAIGALVGALALFFTKTETGRAIWASLMDTLSELWETIAPYITSALQSIGDALAPAAEAFSSFVSSFSGEGGNLTGIVERLGEGIAWLGEAIGQGITAAIPVVQSIMSSLGSAFQSILPVLESVGGALMDGLGQAFEMLAPSFESMGQSVSEIGGLFSEAFGEIMTAMAPVAETFMSELLPAFAELGGAIGEAVSGILPQLAEAFLSIYGALVPLYGQIVSALVPAFMSIVEAVIPIVSMLVSELVPIFLTVVDTVMTLVTTIVSALVPVFQQIVEAVVPIITMLVSEFVPVLLQIIETVLQVATTIISAIVPLAAAIIGALVPIISFILELLVPVIQGILTVVVSVFQAIAPIIQAALEIVVGIIQTITALITGDWQGVWDGILAILQGVWNLIVSVVQGAITIVWGVITGALQIISGIWSAIWGAIGGFVTSIWGTIRSVVSSGISAVQSVISSVLSAIRAFFTSIWNAIVSVVTSAIGRVRSTVTGGMNAARAIVSTVLNAIRSLFSSIWSAITSVVSSAISAVRSVISSGMNAARSVVSSVLNGIRSTFSNILSAIVSVVTSGISRVVSGFTSGMNRALSAVRGFIGKFRSVGGQIISGLVSGIKGAAGKAVSAAKGVVNDALGGAKKLLGISSPSKEFAKIGEWSGEGFVNGLESMSRTAAKSAAKMVQLPDAPQARLAIPGNRQGRALDDLTSAIRGSTTTAGGINVNVTPPETSDPGVWGTRVADTLDLYGISGKVSVR